MPEPGAARPPGPLPSVLRHGETVWSRDGRHTGVTDVGLTADGEEQARRIGTWLGAERFDLVLTSPRTRARRTAELAGLVPYEVDPDLAEWDYGRFEGLTSAEIRSQVPGWSVWDGPWEGGETSGEVAARADRVIHRILGLEPGARVALVGHGHFSRVLGARWVSAPVTAGRWLGLDTGSLSTLGWEHDYRVVRLWNVVPPAR
jgi:broad specificity phosphatase PhoE